MAKLIDIVESFCSHRPLALSITITQRCHHITETDGFFIDSSVGLRIRRCSHEYEKILEQDK